MILRLRRLHTLRGLRIGAALAVSVAALVFTEPPEVRAQPRPTPVEIAGSGSWEAVALVTEWAKTVFGTPTPIQLTYLGKGDRDGRTQFVKGLNDFAISGRPLTKDDQDELAQRKLEVISAPIAVSALVFLVAGPYPTGLRTITLDPNDPEEATFAPYTGPLRMRNELLARTLIRRTPPGGNWADPTFQADLGLPAGTQLAVEPTPALSVARSDPGAANWYLSEFSRRYAPGEWAAALAEAGASGDVQSESWPLVTANTRSGSQAVAQVIGSWRNPGASSTPLGGTIGPVGISSAVEQLMLQAEKAEIYKNDPSKDPPTPLWIAQMRNGAGEWVAASPDSISIAAEAGAKAGVRAMYGLTENVPGAWPFWWATEIFMPASGLSPSKATALASFVRWAVTAGQSATKVTGDGRLPAVWAEEAIAAADKMLRSNCIGSDRRVEEVTNGGPMWPQGAPVPGGKVSICVALDSSSAPTTGSTTVAASSAGGGFAAAGTGGRAPRSTFRSAASSVGAGVLGYDPAYDEMMGPEVEEFVDGSSSEIAASNSTASAGQQAAVQPAASSMPLRDPDDGRGGLDRLTTLLLGGVAFFLLRSSLTRRTRDR